MERKTRWALAGTAAVLVGLMAWAFAPRPVAVEVGRASVGPFETTIDEDARTRLKDRYVVSAPLAGRLQRMSLREGDAVAAGDVLATLTPVLSPLLDERTRHEQQARLGAAEAALERARTRVRAADVALEQARTAQRRTEQLAQQGFVAPTQIDAERLATQAAQQERDTAVQGVHVAEHDLGLARAALGALGPAGSRAAAAGFAVRAPVAGRVLKVHQPSEGTVALGAPLVEIGDTARLEIVAELLSSDALQATPGREVRIERWGGPQVLQGRVRRVEPAAFTKVSALGVEEQRVNVLIDLTSPSADWAALGDGFRVGVRIVTRSEPRALTVPVSAVFPLPAARAEAGATGTTGTAATASAATPAAGPGEAVFVVDGGRARLQPVQTVARNTTQAWLRSGVNEGAPVIIYPGATVADGVRVAPRGP